VEALEAYYVFNPRKLPDARIGCAILKEAFLLETEKQERAERAKREEKAAKEAAAKNASFTPFPRHSCSHKAPGETGILRRP